MRPAGSASVRGTVRGTDARPLDGAQIALFGFPTAVRTASDGSVSLSLPSGTQVLELRAIGYAPSRLTFELTTGQHWQVDARLDRPSAQALAPVNIVGRRSSFDRTGSRRV